MLLIVIACFQVLNICVASADNANGDGNRQAMPRMPSHALKKDQDGNSLIPKWDGTLPVTEIQRIVWQFVGDNFRT